jgi:hypothetical protein
VRWARAGRTDWQAILSTTTWYLMLRRCEDPSDPRYRHYGGQGIEVCPEWHDVTAFITWIEANIGPRPDGMTLDRYPDPAGNYEPGNVRWATDWQQSWNTRNRPEIMHRREQVFERWQQGESPAAIARELAVPSYIVKGDVAWFRQRIALLEASGRPG